MGDSCCFVACCGLFDLDLFRLSWVCCVSLSLVLLFCVVCFVCGLLFCFEFGVGVFCNSGCLDFKVVCDFVWYCC